MNIADIPKIYTALAEWGSCLVFVPVMKKRWGQWKTAGILAVFLAVLSVLQYYIGVWPVAFWIPTMTAAMGLMCLCIGLCCEVTLSAAVLCFSVDSFAIALQIVDKFITSVLMRHDGAGGFVIPDPDILHLYHLFYSPY